MKLSEKIARDGVVPPELARYGGPAADVAAAIAWLRDHPLIDTEQAAETLAAPRTAQREIRPDQSKLRDALMEAYEGRCAITGCAIPALLDAAHLPGRDWKQGHNEVNDAILLRVDLHRLLDEGFLAIDRSGVVALAEPVRADPAYAPLHGQRIRFPADRSNWPRL